MGDPRGLSGIATGATPDVLPAGSLIASRYRLQRRVYRHGAITLWRADDLVLARPVAVHVLDTADIDAEEGRRFIDAAVAAGQIANTATAATFDADDLGDLSYVVSEWVEGLTLGQLLSDGPLPTGRMRGLLLPVARLLADAHAHGVQHGQLQPRDVIITGHGGVKVLGLGITAPGGAAMDSSDGRPRTLSTSEAEHADVRALGALVYASLTGRWPLGGGELPPAPLDDTGRLCAPRQVRAGVPRQADAIAVAALGLEGKQAVAPLRSAAEVAAALDSLPYDEDPPTPPIVPMPAAERPGAPIHRPSGYPPPPDRRRLTMPIAVAVLAVIAVIAVYFATRPSGGSVPDPPAASRIPSSSAPASSTRIVAPAAVRDFDPYGHPPEEQPQLVPQAHDGNPGTAWLTETYSNAQLGSLKPGVGLMLDFGRPVTVRQLELTFPFAGQSVEVRAGDTAAGSGIDAYPVVWSAASTGATAVAKPTTSAPHRYWVIWLTHLVAQNGGFQGGVSEVVARS